VFRESVGEPGESGSEQGAVDMSIVSVGKSRLVWFRLLLRCISFLDIFHRLFSISQCHMQFCSGKFSVPLAELQRRSVQIEKIRLQKFLEDLY